MHRLSAVVITHNEERNIARCLDALKRVADEIIIIDSLSTDATQDICRAYGVQFIQMAWKGFGPQKNYGLQQAANNYILAVDADEVLTNEAIDEVLRLKENGLEGVYEFPLINYYFGKFLRHGQEYPNYKKRLFDKSIVHWNNNKVHEGLIAPGGYPVIRLKGHIEHYSYHSIEHYLEKANLYTSIAANELYKKGKRKYTFKLLFAPCFTFFQSYIIKAGFLDGMHGFIVAFFNGHTNFLKYAKLRQLCMKEKSNPVDK